MSKLKVWLYVALSYIISIQCTLAQEVKVDFTEKRQMIKYMGINMEGYHTTGGTEILKSSLAEMLSSLPVNAVRVGLPLKEWEPVNDNKFAEVINEQGFTSTSLTRGKVEELQAAAIAYAYYIADSNPYIDAFIMSRQVDAPVEVNTSCSFGLYSCDMSQPNDIVPTMPKPSWNVYKNIDNRRTTLETTEKYKQYIGIEKWSDVIPNFRWRNLEN